MQQNLYFTLFFMLSSFSFGNAQTVLDNETLIPQPYYHDYFLHGEKFKGAVKKVTTQKHLYIQFEFDSILKKYKTISSDTFIEESKEVSEYLSNGKLLRREYINKNGIVSSDIQNTFNDSGQLIHSVESRKIYDRTTNNLKRIHIEEEKRIYTEYGKLKEVWGKSSYQNNFFLKQRYTYQKDTLLVKHESLNNHVFTSHIVSCKGGIPDSDYVIFYGHDQKKRLVQIKTYVFEYDFSNEYGKPVAKRNLSEYKLKSNKRYIYNKDGKTVKKINTYRKRRNDSIETSIEQYIFDSNNRLRQAIIKYNTVKGNLKMYEYDSNNGKLCKTLQYTVRFKDNTITSQKLYRITEKNNEGYKSYYYKGNQLVEEVTYSIYGDELLRIDFEENTKLAYEYVYDAQGNWTSKTFTENGVKKEQTFRQIKYFSK
ncbi:YD repeat-containing protein [Kordia periserrulae]|uniref:YD repeat-containing protein n=1 Tax=Kordia periserrulae TaxID=701523 RepID=A0A2T6C629_9FLAO|nr:hypothetical protein [Kordia periserrulae]PTX63768.1 YD repeat-containing protein [Kordia periserrulae]